FAHAAALRRGEHLPDLLTLQDGLALLKRQIVPDAQTPPNQSLLLGSQTPEPLAVLEKPLLLSGLHQFQLIAPAGRQPHDGGFRRPGRGASRRRPIIYEIPTQSSAWHSRVRLRGRRASQQQHHCYHAPGDWTVPVHFSSYLPCGNSAGVCSGAGGTSASAC